MYVYAMNSPSTMSVASNLNVHWSYNVCMCVCICRAPTVGSPAQHAEWNRTSHHRTTWKLVVPEYQGKQLLQTMHVTQPSHNTYHKHLHAPSTYMHTYMYTYIHTYMCIQRHIFYIQTHWYLHTYIHIAYSIYTDYYIYRLMHLQLLKFCWMT